MIRILFSIVLLSGCGSDSAKEDPTAEGKDKGGGIQYQNPPAKEVVVEYRKDGDSYAITVNDTAELPVCERANSKQLAWVKTTNQFFSCEDASWVEIPMKPAATVAGAAGAEGAAGPKGDKGDPGEPVTGNQWFDPVTARAWLIGSAQQQNMVDGFPPCTNGWRLGTKEEVRAGVQHGLGLASVAAGGAPGIWTSELSEVLGPGIFTRTYVDASGSERAGVPVNPTAGIACLKE